MKYLVSMIPFFIFLGCGSLETSNEAIITESSEVLSENVHRLDTNESLSLNTPSSSDDLEGSEPIELNQSVEQNSTFLDLNRTSEENLTQVLISSTTTTPLRPSDPFVPITPVEEENIQVEEPVVEVVSLGDRFVNEQKCDQVVDKVFLSVCYDYQKKAATSVTYTLAGDLVNELNIQERPSFYEESTIQESYRATLDDYSGSGYDRGHLAPDAAFDWSQESLDATYSLANIIPQVPTVNRYMWVDVESYARDKAVELGTLEVVNLIDYQESNITIGAGEVLVSRGYYKILSNQEEEYQECFYYANDPDANNTDDSLLMHWVDCEKIL